MISFKPPQISSTLSNQRWFLVQQQQPITLFYNFSDRNQSRSFSQIVGSCAFVSHHPPPSHLVPLLFSVNSVRQRFRESRNGKTSPASITFGLVWSRLSSFLINSCLSSYIIICHLSHLFSLHRYRSIAISKSLPAADCRNQEPRQLIFLRNFFMDFV